MSRVSGEKVELGRYPTPVHRLVGLTSGQNLFVKRDDLASDLYGGNKVRKLEYLFGEAKALGRTRILTLGAAGSHQVVATVAHGVRHGFDVHAVLVPQPRSVHAERNLRFALTSGLTVHAASRWALAPPAVVLAFRPRTYFIPLGASNVVGSLGFVDAADELARQVSEGELPEPEVVVVALGSGGTAAGLAVGFVRNGLRTRVVGVAVSHPAPLLRRASRSLARRIAVHLGVDPAAAASRVEVDGSFVGRGYGRLTFAGQAAMADARAVGLELDGTYTAKAFACALGLARRPAVAPPTILYWHTLGTVPPGDDGPPLPRRLARLFR